MMTGMLAAAIVAAYGVSLWWLLRQESSRAMLGLAVLCGIALSLRVVYTSAYPWGMDLDQPRELTFAAHVLASGEGLFGLGATGLPVLLSVLFKAQLIPLLGAGQWASEGYSLVGSVLSVAVGFAVARSLAMRLFPSLVVAALIATLPWSIYYGRVDFGGELVFHQLLLLAALARLVRARGGCAEVAIGALGLCLLQYDYQAGHAMLLMPLVAAVLARGHRRALCLAVLLLACLGWAPHLWVSGTSPFEQPGMDREAFYPRGIVAALDEKAPRVARALVEPGCTGDPTLSLAAGAVHPVIVLVLAVVGSLWPPRRALFLWGGFIGGLLPAVLSGGDLPSSHRLLMAYPFISLAAGSALDGVRWKWPRAVASCVVAVVAGVQAVSFYFSAAAWPPSAVEKDRAATELVAALPPPPHPRFLLSRWAGTHFEPFGLADPSYELLHVENWFPPDHDPRIYGFVGETPLRAFYEELVGPGRVRTLPAGGFLVEFEHQRWGWLRRRGWWHRARCGGEERIAAVPALYSEGLNFRDLDCEQPVTYTWRGRWNAPPADLRLEINGAARIETSTGISLSGAGDFQTFEFAVVPGDRIEINLELPAKAPVVAKLFQRTRASRHVPSWESIIPDSRSHSGDRRE